jgi:DNA polymerase III sliding clamp (beta) subunit (PCNA family)
MKSYPSVSFPLQRLKAALTGLGKVVSRKATLPVLGCIRLACDPQKNLATLTVSDLDIHLELDLPAHCGSQEGAFLINFEELRDGLKNGSGDDLVTLRQDSAKSVTLIRERGDTSISVPLPSLPVEEFPECTTISKRPFDLAPADRDSLLQAMACVSGDPTRHVIQGVKLEQGHTFVGTDGRHLYRSNSMSLPIKGDVILPYHRLLDWKPLQEEENWQLALQKDCFRFSGGTWRMTGKLIDGAYPNWKQVLPGEAGYNSALCLPPAALEQLLSVLKTLPGEKTPNKPVGLHCSANGFELLARARYEDPYTVVPIPGTFTGEPITVFVNRDYLGKALGFGLNRIEFGDSTTPVRLREDGSTRRDLIVMPVRVVAAPESSPETTEPPAPDIAPEPPMKPTPATEETQAPAATNGHAANTTQRRENAPELPALDMASINLQQVREYLRMALAELGELANALKQARNEQRNTEREVRQVRSTIRTLQKVEL